MRGKIISAMAGIFFIGSANADLINISTSGYQSSGNPQIACTIVGYGAPYYQGMKVLVTLSEGITNSSNPKLFIQYLNYDIVVTNNDWRGAMYFNGEDVSFDDPDTAYDLLLRKPKRSTDAGAIIVDPPGAAVCAYSSEETRSGELVAASVSITDVTSRFTALSESELNDRGSKFVQEIRDRIFLSQ